MFKIIENGRDGLHIYIDKYRIVLAFAYGGNLQRHLKMVIKRILFRKKYKTHC